MTFLPLLKSGSQKDELYVAVHFLTILVQLPCVCVCSCPSFTQSEAHSKVTLHLMLCSSSHTSSRATSKSTSRLSRLWSVLPL